MICNHYCCWPEVCFAPSMGAGPGTSAERYQGVARPQDAPLLYDRRRVVGENPRYLLLLLHGLGTNGSDLIGLADWLAPLFQRVGGLVVVAPDAPQLAYGGEMGEQARQWFALPQEFFEQDNARDRAAQSVEDGVKASAGVLSAYIEHLLQSLGIAGRRTFVLGFSQGAMMALYVAPRLSSRPLAGVIAASGLLPDQGMIYREIRSHSPVLMVHGRDDPVVPFAAAEVSYTMLQNLGVPVQSLFLDQLGHTINNQALRGIQRFVAERVDSHSADDPAPVSSASGSLNPGRTTEMVLPQVGLSGSERRIKEARHAKDKAAQEKDSGDKTTPVKRSRADSAGQGAPLLRSAPLVEPDKSRSSPSGE